MFTHLSLSYATWKTVRTAVAGTTYYVEHDNEYILIIVDNTEKIVSLCRLIRVPTTSADVSNFDTTIKGTATVVNSVNEAIAQEVY